MSSDNPAGRPPSAAPSCSPHFLHPCPMSPWPGTSWAAPSVPLALVSVSFRVPNGKKKVPKNQEQEFGPTHPCLDGVFVLVTSLATGQPWPSVLGPMSREGLSHGSECAAQLGLDPLRGGQWVWWALGLVCLRRGGSRHVYNRRLFSFCPPE